ncbi:hypothetical protein CCMA1212_006057 [Trichoderma ghanense]|uniref:Uncharacterized protein n=1 Tax=Trichoderma ghanense TaxID=65468 RepID=A0ABY2H389_9HYPO
MACARGEKKRLFQRNGVPDAGRDTQGGSSAASSVHLLHKSPGRSLLRLSPHRASTWARAVVRYLQNPLQSPKYLASGWSPDVGSALVRTVPYRTMQRQQQQQQQHNVYLPYLQHPRFALPSPPLFSAASTAALVRQL